MLANMKGANSAAPASPAQPEDAGEKEWVNPFADLDDSRVQVPSAGRKMKDISPPGLMETELFVRAKRLAEDGQELAKEAFAARDSGARERFREIGLQARATPSGAPAEGDRARARRCRLCRRANHGGDL